MLKVRPTGPCTELNPCPIHPMKPCCAATTTIRWTARVAARCLNNRSSSDFHCDGRLTTEIQGGTRWSVLQHGDHLLAQRNHREASVTATLLATDQQRSVLNTLDATGPHPLAYSPYGHHPAVDRLLSLRGFNGEQPDPLTGHYHLGNGYRQFNPVLMRFNSPDSWSPFGEGELNAYGYCLGNPVTGNDRSGHTRFF